MKLEPEIENWKPIKFVGMEIGEDELLHVEMPIAKLWGRFEKTQKKIPHRSRGVAYGLYMRTEGPASHAIYVAATAVSEFDELPEGHKQYEIPGGLYALFQFSGGVDALEEASQYIYSEWLPKSGYEIREGFDMEMYAKDYDEKGIVKIAVPVRQIE